MGRFARNGAVADIHVRTELTWSTDTPPIRAAYQQLQPAPGTDTH